MAKIERESINFKLPKTLTAALRAKARKLNTTATDLVIQGLEHVLDGDGTDNSVESRLLTIEAELKRLATHTENRADSSTETPHLEQEVKALANRLSLIENAIVQLQQNPGGGYRGRKQSAYSHYKQPPMELQPLTEEKLAKRLLTNVANLTQQRTTMTPLEFESWVKSRDPGRIAWQYKDDGLYHPVK